MWAYRLDRPRELTLVDTDVEDGPLGPGEVRLRFLAGGICGSDMPKFTGVVGPSVKEGVGLGFPLHEVVGEVIESTSERLRVGDRAVGWANLSRGLRERFTSPDDLLYPVPAELSAAEAVVLQPLATAVHAVTRLEATLDGGLDQYDVAVLGLGPLGLLFSHVLAARGARSIVGVDPVDRSEVAAAFGIGELVTATSREWAAGLADGARPGIVVEAVGHQQGTLADAVHAAAPHGHVFAFGVPDDQVYEFPFGTLFRKHLTLHAGTTVNWSRALGGAAEHLLKYRSDFTGYVTHVLPVTEAQHAFDLCTTATPDRIKVVIAL